MSKPDWKDAPEWANYLAMDENGQWFWFENKPADQDDYWEAIYGGAWEEAIPDSRPSEWKQTLERRP